MKLYTIESLNKLMDNYINSGGEVITLEEGCLGLGTVVCFGYGLKTAVINEVFLNEWSSGHTCRMYNKMPQKYELLINCLTT